MTQHAQNTTLFPASSSPETYINSLCHIYDEGQHRVVMVGGLPMFRYDLGDRAAEAVVVAQMLEAGFAQPGQLAVALQRGVATIHRYRQQYLAGGVQGVLPKKTGPKQPRLGAAREAAIRRWTAEGLSKREMGRRLGVGEATVRRACQRLGLDEETDDAERQQPLLAQRQEQPPDEPVEPAPANAELSDSDTGAQAPLDADSSDADADAPPASAQDSDASTEAVVNADSNDADADAPASAQDVEADADAPACADGGDADARARMSAGDDEASSEPSTEADDDGHSRGTTVQAGCTASPDAVRASDEAVAAERSTIEPAEQGTRPSGPPKSLPYMRVAQKSFDTDPTNRVLDRLLASQGALNDAEPVFVSSPSVPRAGVLLAVPLLVASGVFEAAEKVWGHIGPAFYGLRTTMTTLVFLALLRVKHPENIKEYSPPELGRVLGLDRAPEVKTVRGKLTRLAKDGKVEAFQQALIKRRVASRSEALGYLYVDGHVRVYTGKAKLPKTHVARMNLSLPATQELWVNDAEGAPVFFVTQEAHPSLVGALPAVLERVRRLVGKRRVTVVFDRGGWSPKLFQKMDESGFDVLTYRKGKAEPVATDAFSPHEVPGTNGKLLYQLHDTEISLLRGKFAMRQITRRKGEHQTHIVTTRRDLDAVDVARRMFERWRQENFFKYMRQEYAIDALVEHGEEPADPNRSVPNPERRELHKKLRAARDEVKRLEASYGAAAIDNPESKRPSMRGFKIAHGTEIGIPLREARERVAALAQQHRQLPARVPAGQVANKIARLPSERKRLSDTIKMLAYQVETDLERATAPFYARSLHEGRRLLRAALHSAADLEVTKEEIKVTLAPQSSPHRSQAIARLCDILNATGTCFPGTSLPIHYAVEPGNSITEPQG